MQSKNNLGVTVKKGQKQTITSYTNMVGCFSINRGELFFKPVNKGPYTESNPPKLAFASAWSCTSFNVQRDY